MNDSDDKILALITGGTFDKEYDEIRGQLFFKDSHLPEMLSLGRCRLAIEVRTLMMVDSLEMTDADREIIADHCRRARHSKILITHGTDTMLETAQHLAKHFNKPAQNGRGVKLAAQRPGEFLPSGGANPRPLRAVGKTIVLTGAMIPYKFGSSDGLFNLGSALAFVQTLPQGVYVVMNGRCFLSHEVRKNRASGVFEDIQQS